MSLKPEALTPGQLKVAQKALLGYEQQLYVSHDNYLALGTMEIVAPNSGVYNADVAENLALASQPMELMAMLDTDAELGEALTITVQGTDEDNNPVECEGTFQPPSYAQDQTYGFPRGWAIELTADTTRRVKAITNVAVSYGGGATHVKINIFGVPSLDFSANGSFRKIGMKVSMSPDPKVPMPTAVQDGRDKGAQIKSGAIEVGTLDITAKIPTGSDGLARVNGKRVTGWIREVKEDKVHTQNILLLGLIMTAKPTVGEGEDPATFTATSMFEHYAFIMAG